MLFCIRIKSDKEGFRSSTLNMHLKLQSDKEVVLEVKQDSNDQKNYH